MKTKQTLQFAINRNLRIGDACGVIPSTSEDFSLAFAKTIGNAVCHRINFPKGKGKAKNWAEVSPAKVTRKASQEAKMRPLLSEQEMADVQQTVTLALLATGAFESRAMSLSVWKACFRAARGRDCLRIDRKAKSGNEQFSIDALTDDEIANIAATEGFDLLPAKRAMIARKVSYARSLCFAAHRAEVAEGKRQAKSNLTKALAFVAFLASQYRQTGKGISEVVNSESSEMDALLIALRMKKSRFEDYCAKGEKTLTSESLAAKPLTSGTFYSLSAIGE